MKREQLNELLYQSLETELNAMEMALQAGDPAAAQLVASECVTLAETKDSLESGADRRRHRNRDRRCSC